MKAVSLLYHDVVEPGEFHVSGRRGGTADRFKMPVGLFEEHLSAIRERGCDASRTVLDLVAEGTDDRSAGQRPPVMLTFDDGGCSASTHIADRLEELGWRGHFFIISSRIGQPGFLTSAEIRSLRSRGHVIGTHTYSHPRRISHLPWDELASEWRRGADELSEVLGERVRIGSVPGGFYSRRVARGAREAGLRRLFTSEPTTTVRRVEDCLVFGRYSLFGESPPDSAGRLATRDPGIRALQWAHWNLKKVLKAVGGEGYFWLRRKLIGGREAGHSRRDSPPPARGATDLPG